jgi:hypothetical protein
MEQNTLTVGLQRILDEIYLPKNYYNRVIRLFKEYRPEISGKFRIQPGYIGALFKSILFLGIIGKERVHYWRLIVWTLVMKPKLFPLAITYSIHGFHFRKMAESLKESGMFMG